MADLSDLAGRSNRAATSAISSNRTRRRATAQRRARPLPRAVGGEQRGPIGPRTQRNLDLLATMAEARERRTSAPPPPAPPEEKRQGGFGGFISGLGRMAKGIPQGVIGLGMQAGDSALGVPRLLIDLARQRVPDQVNTEGDQGIADNIMSGVGEYFPLAAELAESGERTVHRATNPTEYMRAWEEGTLAEALVEDIGNVALAGGATSRILGRASRPATLTAGEARAVTGAVRPRSLSAMTADDIAIAPTLRNAATRDPGALTRVVPNPAMSTVTLPGRGLAGIAERAGRPTLAAGLERAGNVTRSATRLGERGANLPAAPYVLAGRAGGRAVEAITGSRPGALLRQGVERAGARGGVLFPFTDEGQRFNEVKSNIERSNVDAQRFAIIPARIAEEAGLAPAEARAALLSVDQAVQPIVAMVREFGDTVGDEAIDDIIRRAYEGQGPGGTSVEPGMRPTPADVRAVIAFEDRALPEQTLAGMDAVADAQRTIAEQRTQVQVEEMPEGQGLNPEQLGTEQRSFVLERERRKIERGRNRAQRAWETETARAARLTRIADATEAINATLPEPPRADLAFSEGRRVGRAAAQDSLARRAHRSAQAELRKALDAYVRADGPSDAVQAAAANLDRLTERAVELEAMVRQAERRADAGAALTRASGEVEPGAPREFEGMTPRSEVFEVSPEGEASRVVRRPRPLTGEGPVVDEQGRPPVDVDQADNVTAVRNRARAIGTEEARTIHGEIEAMTDGERPSMPPKRADAGGEYDFWWGLDPTTQRMLAREGWFRKRGKNNVGPDELAASISRNRGGELSIDEAMGVYIDAVQRYHAVRGGRTPEIMAQVAEELGLRPDVVETALGSTADVYRGRIADVADQALDDLRGDYMALSPEERASFDTTLDEMLGQADVSPSDFMELFEAYLPDPGLMAPDGPLAALGNMVDMAEVARFIRTGERPASMRAIGARRGPTQQRQMGRLEGDVQGARRRLSDAFGEQRAGRRTLSAAERQADRQLGQAGRAVDRAGRRADATTPTEGPSLGDVQPDFDNTWRRYHGFRDGETTTPRSRGERALLNEGATRARAEAAQARVARLRRSIDQADERIADLPNELSRRFQERLATDINRPTIVRVRNVVRKGGSQLGELIDDQRTGPYLTGNLRRLAIKYRVYDEVVDTLSAMRQDIRRPLAAVDDEGGVPLDEITPTDRGAVLLGELERKGVTMDSVDAQSLADSVGADQLLDDIAAATRDDRVAGLAANTPYRVADLVNTSTWRMPDDVRSQFEKVLEGYEKQRARHLSTVFDRYAEAAPARFRRLMQTGRRQVKALLDVAEERNRIDPGSGNIYIRMAESTTTTLNELVDEGIDPTHLIGGDEIDAAFTAGTGRRLSQRGLRSEHVAKTGLRPLDPDAVSRVEADQMAKIIHNRTSRYVVEQFGRRADQVPAIAEAMREWEATNAEPMPPKQLAKVAKEAGWVPHEGTAVDPQTMLVSEAIDRQLRESRLDQSKVWNALRSGNRKWKSWVLPLSPKWITGNIIGNIIQAQVHAGVNPVTLVRRMREIAKQEGGLAAAWDRSGLPDWAPAELASHGLSYNEWRIMYQQAGVEARTPVGRIIARSYKLNEFVDNLTRSAVLLEQLKQGVPSQQAMNVALKSLGDFTKMSSFERRVVREILPFYAWMRHQTLATLRLPIHSPTRAAWLLHLADLYTDPEMQDSLLEFIGNSIPLGGDSFLDIGSISPFASLPEVPFAPTTIGRSVSPLIKVPLAVTTGVDLNRGGQQITRPAGTMRRGPYGSEEQTPPIYRLLTDPVRGLGEIGYVATQQAPSPIRSLRDLALGPNARYGTGYEVTSQGRPIPDERRSRLSVLLRGLNLPAPRTIDVEEMQRRAEQQQRRQRG